jgi:glycosyltransferase involved in cell wall biosynthesis
MITTNVSGCPETVGDAGFLIDFDDDAALHRILVDLCCDKGKMDEYSRKSYQRLIDNFLWAESVEKYLSLLARN